MSPALCIWWINVMYQLNELLKTSYKLFDRLFWVKTSKLSISVPPMLKSVSMSWRHGQSVSMSWRHGEHDVMTWRRFSASVGQICWALMFLPRTICRKRSGVGGDLKNFIACDVTIMCSLFFNLSAIHMRMKWVFRQNTLLISFELFLEPNLKILKEIEKKSKSKHYAKLYPFDSW